MSVRKFKDKVDTISIGKVTKDVHLVTTGSTDKKGRVHSCSEVIGGKRAESIARHVANELERRGASHMEITKEGYNITFKPPEKKG